ncbi:MAG: hypothetical protein ACREQI_00700 [Candidatus Binataceae bacterium]
MRTNELDSAPLYESVRRGRSMCSGCGQHSTGFIYRGRFKHDDDHDLPGSIDYLRGRAA